MEKDGVSRRNGNASCGTVRRRAYLCKLLEKSRRFGEERQILTNVWHVGDAEEIGDIAPQGGRGGKVCVYVMEVRDVCPTEQEMG